ncbi:MAG: hypothetical protein B7Y56_03045 [Gallionellales bacterium 35-53-114]|jgi:uncharacterized phiE125 gp8 family phage protein|nr:MAG: hypothetical protein B7Y56_03045 [Gallionellales bacterium 35-53-114]OYZ65084.1 MAG: hypothetical protein B7Y04_00205 [Gallionellales bacterium 24-53-125]OZB07993.1 MAG: hypothetical protein B7X61_10655 [Gallionellales bacterium 39-52-133]HQS59734.1 head-tail connector protein [Gallionellaceae bacterium]
MSLIVIIPPSEEPVTLAEAKLHCKIEVTDDDTLITSLITATRQQAEHITGRAFCTQTLELVLDAFPDPEAFKLPMPPAIAITSVKYIDTNGVEQTLDAAAYSLDKDSQPGSLSPAYDTTWPDTRAVPNAVRVRYTAGYGAAAAVPASIKSWMLMAIGTLYASREAIIIGTITSEVPRGFFAALLDPYWIPRL